MQQFSAIASGSGGHPAGGPRSVLPPRTVAAGTFLIAAVMLLGGCGGGAREGARAPREPFARPLEIYRDLGFMTGPGQFPAVASFGTVAGPADSTFVVLGLSLPNNALRFQREGAGFVAEYTIDLAFMNTDSVVVRRFSAAEAVRVASFAETSRSDESVVFQRAYAMPPGSYIVRLQAADVHSSRGFRMTDTLTAPMYGPGGSAIASPLLVYKATGRSARAEHPDFILNPRHTVPYGGAPPILYLEAYTDTTAIDVRVRNEAGVAVWHGSVALPAAVSEVRFGVVTIPSDTFPLGRFSVEIGNPGHPSARTPLVLTISDQWMVSNFEDVLQFLRFIAHAAEIDSLREGTPPERRILWENFWARRDPLPVTGTNEFRERFFQRVRFATDAFREPGRAGWQTDRGEVFIVLGSPDHAVERNLGRVDMGGQPNAVEWVYGGLPSGRLNLIFHDRTGFGRFELVPGSAAAFRSAAERMKPRPPRN
jgi:GWxTD domain-containing protein